MSPEDLAWDVAATRLGGHRRRLGRALQNDDDLEALLVQQVLGGHVVEGRALVDRVHHVQRPDEEDAVLAVVRTCDVGDKTF